MPSMRTVARVHLLLPVLLTLWVGAARSAELLETVRAPSGLQAPGDAPPVVIAIVDDAVRTTHRDLQPFLWHNPKEIPGNRIDDDGNARIDDVVGWDVSDADADVSPPPGREAMFYHGTHLAGIVVQVVRRAYGAAAPDHIRILPVKCLADDAEKPYLKDGYRGIQYAVEVGADIILAAWGVPHASPRELRILQAARDRGAWVVASAGNFPTEREQFPAAFPPVLAVTAADPSGAKMENAAFGGYVDLVAPGEGILSADASSDTARQRREGTSMAAAIVAGAAAVVKLQHPGATLDELSACLKNTAESLEPFQHGDIFYGGKLGAGRLNLAAAAAYDLAAQPIDLNGERHQHQGYLAAYRREKPLVLWRIRPEGQIKGFWFDPRKLAGPPGDSRLELFQAGPIGGEPFASLKLRDWHERQFVPGAQVTALLATDPAQPDFQFLVEYASEPIDQSVMFCRDTVRVDREGIIEDGSGPQDYAPRSNCKWLITAPEGKVSHIKFLEFDTEARTDWVYLFNGAGTQGKIMAVFSGPNLPPELTTWGRQTLLWFVTNDVRQGKGWRAQVTFRDPAAGEEAVAP